MTELKDKITKLVKAHERVNRLAKEIRLETNGAIDFGVINEEAVIQIYKGIADIADMFEKEMNHTHRDDTEYPDEYTVMVSNTMVLQIQ